MTERERSTPDVVVPPPPSSRARPSAQTPSSRAPGEPATRGTVVVPLPNPLEPLRRVKSTLLIASVTALRECGHFDAYREQLDPEFDEEVLRCFAGSWVSVAAARAHYRACDRLALPASVQMAIGQRTGDGLKQHLTRLAALVSRSAGVTPWWWFEQFNRFWARTFDGGGICVAKLGPKEADLVYARCSLLESPYFRSALRGVAVGLLGSVTQRSFMSEVSVTASLDEARYRLTWV